MTPSRIGVLSPLRHRDFRLLALASLSSLLGDGFFRVAIAVQVYAIDNDPRALAAVAVAWAGAQVLFLPAGGWASDRFERRRVMIVADLWRASAVGLIGVLSVTDQLEIGHLLLLGAAFGAGNGFFNPAATSLVPDLLPDRDLAQANAFLGVARPGMLWIVGPLLGGLVVELTQPGVAFVLDAASFAFSAPLLALISVRLVGQVGGGGVRKTLRDVGDGLRFVRRQSWARLWLAAAAISTLAFHGPFDVLVPYLFKNDFGMTDGQIARSMALIFAAGGAGSIVASTVIAQHDLPRRFMTWLYGCELLAIVTVVTFGVMTAPWHAMVAGFVIFSMFAVSEIIWHTTMQRHVPRAMLGRVASLDWMASISLALVSFAVAGPLGAAFGARQVLVGAGLLGGLALLLLMAAPGARSIERHTPPPPPSPPTGAAESGSLEGLDPAGGGPSVPAHPRGSAFGDPAPDR